MNTKGAGKANLDCNFSGPTKGEAVKDFEIINNHDNTHTVKYTPVQQVRQERDSQKSLQNFDQKIDTSHMPVG